MNTKDKEYFRLQRNITHINRYEKVNEKMSAFIVEMEDKKDINNDDKDRWTDLIHQQLESLYDMFIDQSEELKNYKAHHDHLSTALRYYVTEYGDHLVSKTFSQEQFMTTITIMPLEDDQTNVKIEIDMIEAKEND